MHAYRIALVSVAATMLAASATLAQPVSSAPPPPTGRSQEIDQHVRAGRGDRMPRELKIMWKQEVRTQLKAIPREQRHAWLKQQWRAMSPEQQQAKLAELQAKWDALPEPARQAALQKMQNRGETQRTKASMSGGASPSDR